MCIGCIYLIFKLNYILYFTFIKSYSYKNSQAMCYSAIQDPTNISPIHGHDRDTDDYGDITCVHIILLTP